jgi:uncharacterized protein (TIGR02452 family)
MKDTRENNSFFNKIYDITRKGRFGEHNARKEVYKENLNLFLKWKKGIDEIGFGDYNEFLDNTKLYSDYKNINGIGKLYGSTETGCIDADCVDVAEKLVELGYNPAILNLASAVKPSGGYKDGISAQEESLCRSSNLSLSLYQYGNPKYINVRESGVPNKKIAYPLDINYGGIYSKNVTFFRHNRNKYYYTLRKNVFKCGVITVAALCFNGKSHYADLDELSFRSESGGFTEEGEKIMLNKIRTIFRIGIENGHDALVLGAFGCGAYKLLPSEVAPLFRRVMEESEFKNKFKYILFAILQKPSRKNMLDNKYAPFYKEFGETIVFSLRD